MWQDPGTWIAFGVSALFIVAGIVMHRIFVNILKGDSAESPAQADGPAAPSETHE